MIKDIKAFKASLDDLVRCASLSPTDPEHISGVLIGFYEPNHFNETAKRIVPFTGVAISGSINYGEMLGNVQIGVMAESLALAYAPQEINKNFAQMRATGKN